MAISDGSRYLIYNLLKRFVDIRDHSGRKTSGVVQKVYRNVMDGVVELTLGGKLHVFDEPNGIRLDDNEVVFLYGNPGEDDDSDEALFQAARYAAHSGESMDDVIRRTAPSMKRETRFRLGPKLTAPPKYARAA